MIAIIARTVGDAWTIIQRAYVRRMIHYGKEIEPKKNLALRDLEELRSHVRHSWFGEICRYAGIHQDLVLRKIEKLEERAKRKHARHSNRLRRTDSAD